MTSSLVFVTATAMTFSTSDSSQLSYFALKKQRKHIGTRSKKHLFDIAKALDCQSHLCVARNFPPTSGQVHGTVRRSNHCVGRAEDRQGLPAAPATHQVLRCRTRQASGLPDQQLRFACADHRLALSLPLAGRTFFKWIKQHLRIKRFYGTTENAVKTQIWIVISVNILVSHREKRLNTEASLYTTLQIL